jgi:A/G-specific adenine glycosylase
LRVALPRARRARIQRRLLDWYDTHQRDLPWRRTRDPYRIWLSEAMLQQTRVETVIPYYDRFVERFPTLEALAVADEEQVLGKWAGLGYYSRARNLKRAAEIVVDRHGGELPRDEAALRALPGVGAYTAGAIRSIAFDQPAPIVDGNVRRVLARLFADRSPEPKETWRIAGALVPEDRPGAFNQALMELGATVCTPRAPACTRCPLGRFCAARSRGEPTAFPAPKQRRAPLEVRAVCGIVEKGSALLMLRRPARGLLGGLWEVPSSDGRSVDALIESIRDRTGVCADRAERVGTVEHLFTHRALELEVFRLERREGRLRGRDGIEARWCTRPERGRLPLSRLMRKTLELAGL